MPYHYFLMSLGLPVQAAKTVTEVNKPIEKQYCDTIVNFLLRLACHVSTTV